MQSVSSTKRKWKIGVAQTTSTADLQKNVSTAHRLISEAITSACDLIAFPEAFLFLGASQKVQDVALCRGVSHLSQEPLIQSFQARAREGQLWILLGSVPETVREEGEQLQQKDNNNKTDPTAPPEKGGFVYNTSILIDRSGELVSIYRKVHLFDLDLPQDGLRLLESSYTRSGERAPCVVSTELGQLGMTICYDLRFPMQYQRLRERGAQIIFIPSAFTVPTGKAHWMPLLRARAIETQCWVVAPAQFGEHKPGRVSYGSSVVIDPWGEVLAVAPEQGGVLITAQIDLETVDQVRTKMPVWAHRVEGLDYYDSDKKSSQ